MTGTDRRRGNKTAIRPVAEIPSEDPIRPHLDGCQVPATHRRVYLRARQRREVDEQLGDAYAVRAGELLEEIGDLVGAQEWPPA